MLPLLLIFPRPWASNPLDKGGYIVLAITQEVEYVMLRRVQMVEEIPGGMGEFRR